VQKKYGRMMLMSIVCYWADERIIKKLVNLPVHFLCLLYALQGVYALQGAYALFLWMQRKRTSYEAPRKGA
jgi:hypothetical protein